MTKDYRRLKLARLVASSPTQVGAMIGKPFAKLAWASRCHEISLAAVKAGIFGPDARVARGTVRGILGQHSWIVLGDDVYATDAIIVDMTWYSTRLQMDPENADQSPRIITDFASNRTHRPHGSGTIWTWGCPTKGDGPIIELTPEKPFSHAAEVFLGLIGPLDRKGWMVLANAPCEEWPAKEILRAIDRTEGLGSVVPIDILGMVADTNPGGLYR